MPAPGPPTLDWPADATDAVIDAYLHGRDEVLGRILEQLPAGDALAVTAVALRSFVLANRSLLPWEGIGPRLDAALADPPPSPELLACLLNATCVRAREMASEPERRRLAGRLRELLPRLVRPRIRAMVHRQSSMIALDDGDTGAALAEIAALDPGDDRDLDLEFRFRRVDARLDAHDLDGIGPEIDRLVASGSHFFDPWRLRARLDVLVGDPGAVVARIDADRPLPPARRRHPPCHTVAEAAALCGRDGLVDELVDEHLAALPTDALRGRHERFLAAVRAHARACLALRRRDYAAARAAIRACGPTAMANPGLRKHLLHLSLRLDLACGATASARGILGRLDPRGTRGDLQVAWARLHRAEGDHAGAAARIARILARGAGTTIPAALAWADEMDAAAAVRLVLAAAPAARDPAPPPPPPDPGPGRLVGDSPAIRAVRDAVAAIAPHHQAVLLLGETGTGKEVVAGLLHAGGRRPSAPLVALNCAAIPDALAESELFGHRRGAYSGAEGDREGLIAAAGDGTLFLDEVDSLSLRLQGLLLRVIETGEFRPVGGTGVLRTRARIIAAAGRDPARLADEGRFRRDLLFRLRRFVIALPPLRERRTDIPLLAEHLLAAAAPGRGLAIDPRLAGLLAAHDWPGNVRELRNAIERMALLCGDRRVLTPEDCPELHPALPAAPPAPAREAVRIPGQPRTRERRRRLLGLFAEQPHLARQEVVRALGCATSTATADLRALCELGLLRRVDTSGHACTSYFTLAGGG